MQDLDTVGHGFFDSLNSPLLIATFLLDLKNYPRRVRWGGKPLSAQPYLYSALFFLQAGKQREALGALESGMEEYRSEMAEKWQKARLGDYSKCKVRLERVISRELN